MMSDTSARRRVSAYRARLRAQGLRPLQLWVPDVAAPEFVHEAHRQSRAVAASLAASDDQAYLDSISSWPDETG